MTRRAPGEGTLRRLIFVGEKRSPTAVRMGVRWQDGRLAAKPLFAGLRLCGVDPSEQEWVNLYADGDGWAVLSATVRRLRRLASGEEVVALGSRVSRELAARGIPHRRLTHPAARGRIRKSERYHAHVREVLFAGKEVCCD